jgi:hypothetical protein
MVFGGMDMFMSGLGLGDLGPMMENFKPLTIGMAAAGMTIYLVVGFVASILISRRRQLA